MKLDEQKYVQFERGRVYHINWVRDWKSYNATQCGIYYHMDGKKLVEVTGRKCKKCFRT